MSVAMSRTLSTAGYDTDKSRTLLDLYERLFAGLVDSDVRLLELGIRRGGSLLLWRDYFPQGRIAGIDVEPVELQDDSGRIRTYRGLQQNTRLLDRVAEEVAPSGFDVIIDDATHQYGPTRAAFRHLFTRHLKPGGFYAVEDWGTGYWGSWHDGHAYLGGVVPAGRSLREAVVVGPFLVARWLLDGIISLLRLRREHGTHSFGMVAFVKELVDECGLSDITRPDLGISPPRDSQIRQLIIMPGVVVVEKVNTT